MHVRRTLAAVAVAAGLLLVSTSTASAGPITHENGNGIISPVLDEGFTVSCTGGITDLFVASGAAVWLPDGSHLVLLSITFTGSSGTFTKSSGNKTGKSTVVHCSGDGIDPTNNTPVHVELDRLRRAYEEHLVQLCHPQGRMWKDIEKATYERARILIVLGRQRPPLGEKAVRPQPCAGEPVEIARIEVDDPCRRWRRRLECNEVVALRTPQELPTTIAQAHLPSGVGSCTR